MSYYSPNPKSYYQQIDPYYTQYSQRRPFFQVSPERIINIRYDLPENYISDFPILQPINNFPILSPPHQIPYETTGIIYEENKQIHEDKFKNLGLFFSDEVLNLKTDVEIFINAIKEQILLTRDLEKSKEKLAFTDGFTIDLVLKKFDDNESKAVTLKEFKAGLNSLGIIVSDKEAFLVMRKYTKDTARMNSNEFENLFLPRSKYLNNKLKKNSKNPEQELKNETILLIKSVLEYHVQLETSWEKLKKTLQTRKTNIQSLFKFLDSDNNDELEAFELKNILIKSQMYPSDEEIELVYKRFNCNKKENEKEVKMLDFIIELTTTPAPKKIEKLSEMLQAIEDQMNIEKQIEKWKEDLLKMKNYKFDELYRLFDVNESNSISPQEFREAITNTLEVKKLKDEDIFMLYQNYNENGDGKLSKKEFQKMISPSDPKIIQNMMFKAGSSKIKRTEGNYKYLVENILEKMIEGEQKWQKAKKIFKSKEENLKELFNYMDYDKNGILTESDFKSFLQESGFMASSSEIFALIRRFDRNGDANIDLEEFLSELGKEQKIKKIELDFSDELASILKGIGELFRQIENTKNELLKRIDFDWKDISQIFDNDRTGVISISEFKEGLDYFGIESKEEECYLLCRRFNRKEFFLSYDEFSNIFKPIDKLDKPLPAGNKKNLNGIIKENSMSYDTKKKIHKLFTLMINFENYWNGIKTTMASKSFDNEKAFKNLDIDKNGTITNKDLENFCSKNDVNSYTNLERKFFFFLFDPNGIETISLETFKKEISPIEKMDKILQKVSVMDDLNDLLKEMIKICRQIETFKKRISQYSIYTKDIFLKIDENCGGSITKKELNRGLDKMGIDLNDEECALLIRQYSQDDDLEIINYQNFHQMFLPFDFTENNGVELLQKSTYRFQNKDFEMKDQICQFFKNLAKCETQAEVLRKKLFTKKVDLLKIYKILDSQDDGCLEGKDFTSYIIKSDISTNKSDIALLVNRFDKDRSGTISREEFIKELSPTSSNYGAKGENAELLTNIFREQLVQLRSLEQRKMDLFKKSNLKIYKIFDVFDENESGNISAVEFRQSLFENLEINSSQENINLLIYYYNKRGKKNDLILRFEEFANMFKPLIPTNAIPESVFAKPKASYRKGIPRIEEDIFLILKYFFFTLLNTHKCLQKIRIELFEAKCDLAGLYFLLNPTKNQALDPSHFNKFCKQHEITKFEDEIKILFTIYDSSDNNKISKDEFENELKPLELKNLFMMDREYSEYFRVIINEFRRILRTIENAKSLMMQQKDFNIYNLFKMIDLNSSEKIGSKELLSFFYSKMGVLINENFSELIIKRFSNDPNLLMSYEEFFYMILPTIKSQDQYYLKTNIKPYKFDNNTFLTIHKFFVCLVDSEREFYNLREQINNIFIKKDKFSIEKLFRIMSKDKNEIDNEDFANFLIEKQIYAKGMKMEIKSLLNIFDKAHKRKVSLDDFKREMELNKNKIKN